LLIVLATSPRVAPGLLSWPAWRALRSADAVLAAAGHPQLPALDEAGISYQVADGPGAPPADVVVVWLPEPGAEPLVPPGAQLLHGSADPPGAHLMDLVATMDRLRVGCPWDARQTHASLAPHLLEEPYEALEALESGDEQAFCEELGDVLLQVVFHARIAAERDDDSSFTIDDVADGIVAKLVRRHPHVFADVTVSGADEVTRNWDEIKKEEKPNGAAAMPPARLLRPRLMAFRSGSPRWRWPRSCRAGRRGPGCPANWPARPRPGRAVPVLTSAASCSGWWPRPGPRTATPRWNCGRRRAAIWTWCAAGNAAPRPLNDPLSPGP